MATPTPPAGIIFQADFDIYTNDWIDIVTNNKETELANCFRQKSGAAQNINYVSFSALQIAQLVSTVGAQNIKARFLVVREAPDKKYPNGYPHFALALFATDNIGRQRRLASLKTPITTLLAHPRSFRKGLPQVSFPTP
jgi:hypothetical protein